MTIFAKVLDQRIIDFCVQVSCRLHVGELALAVALLILCDGLHHGDLSVHRVMIMETVAMHSKLNVHSVWLVDGMNYHDTVNRKVTMVQTVT